METVQVVKDILKVQRTIWKENEYERVIQILPGGQKMPLNRIVNSNASQWLAVIPTLADHTDLFITTQLFRDA